MYKCEHCGKVFDEPHIHKYHEYRGEYWGFPSYEDVYEETCPYCGEENFFEYDEDEEDEEEEEC